MMKQTILLTLAGLASASLCQAAVFANGSFEAGLTGWTPGTSSSQVTLSPTSYGAGASDGTQWIQFGTDSATGGTLAQTFDTIDGTTYQVAFAFGKYGPPGTSGGVNVGVDNTAGTNTDFVDTTGSAYVAGGAAYTAGEDRTNTIFTFVASSTSTTLTFTDITVGGASMDTALDNVRVTAIPEPSSTALLGLAGLALVLRRRK